MSTVERGPGSSTVPALFRHLVDDASMFPPAELPLADAVVAHRRHRQSPYRELVGSFVCADDQLMAVAEQAATTGETPLELSVVITGGAGGIEPAVRYGDRSPDVTVSAVEVRLRSEDDLSRNALRVVRACDDCMDEENAFIEVGLEGAWERALDVVADAGYAAKLRTGGLDSSLFPSATQVAAFITACLDREVPFKCTAGLHNAVRHTAADTGFEHHGFLNLLLATRASLDGASHDEVVAVLENRDGAALAAQARELSIEQAVGTRRWFTSVGSCSVDEPRHDLTELELMEDL
jgi:2-hydroxychromene-2-carboxylate isomerase